MTRKDRWTYTTQGLWVNTAPDDNPVLSSSQVIFRVQSVPRERDSKSARRGICGLITITVDPDSIQSFILSESLLIHIMIDLTVTAFRQDTASSGARTSFIFQTRSTLQHSFFLHITTHFFFFNATNTPSEASRYFSPTTSRCLLRAWRSFQTPRTNPYSIISSTSAHSP